MPTNLSPRPEVRTAIANQGVCFFILFVALYWIAYQNLFILLFLEVLMAREATITTLVFSIGKIASAFLSFLVLAFYGSYLVLLTLAFILISMYGMYLGLHYVTNQALQSLPFSNVELAFTVLAAVLFAIFVFPRIMRKIGSHLFQKRKS